MRTANAKKYCLPFVRALKELDSVCFSLKEADKPHYQAARAAIYAVIEGNALEVEHEHYRLRAIGTAQRILDLEA
jgi:hypothetical protein